MCVPKMNVSSPDVGVATNRTAGAPATSIETVGSSKRCPVFHSNPPSMGSSLWNFDLEESFHDFPLESNSILETSRGLDASDGCQSMPAHHANMGDENLQATDGIRKQPRHGMVSIGLNPNLEQCDSPNLADEESDESFGYIPNELMHCPVTDLGEGSNSASSASPAIAAHHSSTGHRKKMKKTAGTCPKPNYAEPFLQDMLNNVRNGTMSKYHVAKYYGIPRGTLQYRLSDAFRNKGRKGPDCVLSEGEENLIVNWLQSYEKRGFPITRQGLVAKVTAYMREHPRPNPFTNNVPGRKWIEGFMRRHPQLAFRTPEAITSASAKVSEQDIRKWFQTVKQYLVENNLADALEDPSRIINGDETGFVMNASPKKVLATKGAKNVSIVETANGKQNVTVLFNFSADGTVFPPDVILPYKRLSREIVQSFPADWGLGTSDSGWMNAPNFALCIKKVIYPDLVKRGVKFPVLYFVDGHTSHTALEAAEACEQRGIILIALFPNATRILQPADVSIFRPLKNNWEKAVEIWKTYHAAERLSIPTFGSLLRETMRSAFKTSTIVNAFRVCGLYPYNPDAVDYSKCIATSKLQTKEAPEQLVTTTLPVNGRSMTSVPTAAIESALTMIGDEKIQLYKYGDESTFSIEDKALSFICNNILLGHSEDEKVSNSNEHSHEKSNYTEFDLEAAIAEPIIILQEEMEHDPQLNSDEMPVNHDPWLIEYDSTSNVTTEYPSPVQSTADTNNTSNLEYDIGGDRDVRMSGVSVSEKPESVEIALTLAQQKPVRALESPRVLTDCGNFSNTSRIQCASKFFEAPPALQRDSKHRFYKQKSYAILTAGERMEELYQAEIKKAEAAQLKQERAEKRKQNKMMKEAAAIVRAEEKENIKKRKEMEEEKKRTEAKTGRKRSKKLVV